MPELSYRIKIAALFKKIERAAIGTDENGPGYIAARGDGDHITLTLNTAVLPHGAMAGPALHLLAQRMRPHFGDEAVTLEQPDEGRDMDLGIPPAYRLSVSVPDSYASLEALSRVLRDVTVDYCQTALAGQVEEQLDYLATHLGDRQAASVFERMTGATMRHSETAPYR